MQTIIAKITKSPNQITSPKIKPATPLASKTAYTQGDEFVYLQCWLMYEQKVADVVPQFVPSAGAHQNGSYTLQFVPAAAYHAGYRKKEIAAVIQQEFYPA